MCSNFELIWTFGQKLKKIPKLETIDEDTGPAVADFLGLLEPRLIAETLFKISKSAPVPA